MTAPPTRPDPALREADPHAAVPQKAGPQEGAAHRWRPALSSLMLRLFGAWALVLAVVTGLGSLLTRPLADTWPLTAEDGVNRWFAARRTPGWTDLSTIGSGFGNTSTVIVLGLVLIVVLHRVLRRWRESLLVFGCVLGQFLVFLGTSRLIGRARPDVEQLDDSLPTSSFPSGHTSASLALYGGLAVVVHRTVRRAWLRRLLITVLLTLPVLVGTGRLYRGMHHPSDLLGALLNAGLVVTVTTLLVLRATLPERRVDPVTADPDLGASCLPDASDRALDLTHRTKEVAP